MFLSAVHAATQLVKAQPAAGLAMATAAVQASTPLGSLTKSRESREQRSESREQRADSRDQRAESREHRAESREQRGDSREQRAESREQRAGSREVDKLLYLTNYSL